MSWKSWDKSGFWNWYRREMRIARKLKREALEAKKRIKTNLKKPIDNHSEMW